MKTTVACIAVAGSLLFSGCASMRALWPGGVTAADAEWEGVKSAEPISVLGTVDPRAEAAAVLLQALGQSDPLGVLLPVTMVGETTPRWVLCQGELAAKCRSFPLYARVKFAGRAVGPGLLWTPTRLTASNFN